MDGLRAIGVGEESERAYRALLQLPDATTADVAAVIGATPPDARRVLAGLARQGLATQARGRPTRWAAVPPDAAFDVLLARREDELEAARRAAAALDREYRLAHPAGTEVATTLVGREAIGAQVTRLDRVAQRELLVLVRPPYVVTETIESDGMADALGRGVPVRCIYDRVVLEERGAFASLAKIAERGEQARVVSGVPLKLVIADRQLGLLPLHLGGPESDRALLVRSSALLDALTLLFELLWASAEPAPWAASEPPAGEELSELDRKLLGLLTAGLKDETVARQLGIGLRTVRRRVGELMTRLGAQTRFQAGVRARDSGWLR